MGRDEEQVQDTDSKEQNTDEGKDALEIVEESLKQGEEGEEVSEPEKPSISIEDIAREFGWRPESEYKGDKPFVDAATFIRNERTISDSRLSQIQELHDSNKALHTKVDSVAKAMKHLKEHQDKLREAEVAKYKKEIEDLKYTAVEEGDVTKVREYDKQLEELEKSKEEEPVTEETSPEYAAYTAWLERNPWYDENSPEYNEELALIAGGMDIRNIKNGLTSVQSLNRIEKEIKEKYIDKKKATVENKEEKPVSKVPGKSQSMVEGAGRRTSGTHKFTIADLDPAQKAMAREMVDLDIFKNVQEYVDSLVKSGDLK